jgi:PTH1 family peptidyl-tRNA hydrolase
MLIVGLGNPGAKYATDRHNVGFRVVDALARSHSLSFSRQRAKARVAEGIIGGHRVVLAKPQTYMNLSGTAVSRLSSLFEVPPEQLLVAYDDLDLPLGRLRLRPEGGSGGHKGVRSIADSLGTQAFARLRVGIGRPPGRLDPADYVLRPFTKDENAVIDHTIQEAAAAMECWLTEGIHAAMDRFNRPARRIKECRQETQA